VGISLQVTAKARHLIDHLHPLQLALALSHDCSSGTLFIQENSIYGVSDTHAWQKGATVILQLDLKYLEVNSGNYLAVDPPLPSLPWIRQTADCICVD